MSEFTIKPNPAKLIRDPRPLPPHPWDVIAQRILKGEFNKADDSTICSLQIGLKGLSSQTSKDALVALEKLKPKRKAKP